tara:strand:+ start:1887 stop:2273 length:387 start_codon:yes stop_codon:yes gene_type:complete
MIIKNISIISSYNEKKINKKYKNIIIKHIEANSDETISTSIKKSEKHSDLIIIIPGKLKSYNKTTAIIKKINTPIVYCSIDNNDLHDKKNKIIKNLKYVIHGFKNNTYKIIINSALKIINYHGEKNNN